MGYGDDNFIDDERADEALKRLLEGSEIRPAPLSPDLVSRTLQRLPPGPPIQATRLLAARQRRNRVLVFALLLPLLLVAAVNIWGVIGYGPQVAFLFGDGRTGLSMVLLGLQLAVKPFWNTIQGADPALLFGGLLASVVSMVLLRRLVRRFQSQYEVETL